MSEENINVNVIDEDPITQWTTSEKSDLQNTITQMADTITVLSLAEKQSTLDRIAKLEEEVKKLKNIIGSE